MTPPTRVVQWRPAKSGTRPPGRAYCVDDRRGTVIGYHRTAHVTRRPESEGTVVTSNEAIAKLARQLNAVQPLLGRAFEAAPSDDDLLAVRDLLVEHQLATRAAITHAEERLGAFDGQDHPRALAARAEELVEQIELLQEVWEERVSLLLELGYRADDPTSFLPLAPDRETMAGALAPFFANLPAEMDQTIEALEYGRRFLLQLLDPATAPPGPAPVVAKAQEGRPGHQTPRRRTGCR